MPSTAARLAIVTGGGQGLGRAIALQLLDAGCKVAILGRTRAKLDALVAERGDQALAVDCDLTDPNSVRSAFTTVVEQFGRVDILVNNAATYLPFLLQDATDEQINAVITGTLTAPLFTMREAIKAMGTSGGDIVNISSESVALPLPYLTVYAAAKSGLETMTRGLRMELRGQPFRLMNARVGRIADSSASENWAPGLVTEVMSRFEQSGLGALLSTEAAPSSELARVIVGALMTPQSMIIQDFEVRASSSP